MKRTVVRIKFPYALKWDKGMLEVRIEDKVFEVHFERQSHQSTRPSDTGSDVVVTTNLEYERDRLGRSAYTQAEIYFPMYVEDDILNRQELLDWVHAVINRVLAVYRYTTQEFHIAPIPKTELGSYTVRTINQDGTFSNREAMVSGIGAAGGLRVTATQAITEEARHLLRDGTALSIPRMLYLNAKREELYENYRIAVVEAETAFEVLVDQTLTQYYRSQGRPETEVERLLKQTALQNLLRDHIPRCCREPFDGTPEHATWSKDLYNVRNDVVHDGVPVDANQARHALDAAERAIAWIEDRACM
jgi:hypothetical protein